MLLLIANQGWFQSESYLLVCTNNIFCK